MSIVDNLLAVAAHVAENYMPNLSNTILAAEGILNVATGIGPTLTSTDRDALAAGLEPLILKMDRDVDEARGLLLGTGA